MAKRRALIVDDSKTAQVRLRKMLERFDLEVDAVLSAEEALGYLSYRQPAVIFLDHHMEGMDGLEALKIIKSNPSTALIPVIMYTSEKGDVYVGQARALGAIDILGKEVIKHANLEKVLSSLGLAGPESDDETRPLASRTSGQQARQPLRPIPASYDVDVDDGTPTEEPSDLDHVQRQISRLFELHIAKVRQEIEDSTKFLLRRLAKDAQDRSKSQRQVVASLKPSQQSVQSSIPPQEEPAEVPEPERSALSTFVLGVILLGIAFLGYHLYINNRHQELLSDQYDELIDRTRNQEELIGRLFERVTQSTDSETVARSFADRQLFMDALSWAVNVNTRVPYGEQPLNDQRIYTLGELLALLKASEFSGTVYLDVHLGDFCVIEDFSGSFILPEPESNVEDCIIFSTRQPDVPLSQLVSVGFMNYLQSAPILAEGDIQVELTSRGFDEPLFSYPSTSGSSAGEWNAAAHKNNRISVSFSAN